MKYIPGKLNVVAYKNGKTWATDSVQTTGKTFKLASTPDRSTIHADGLDLSFITVKVLDKNGLVVPKANQKLNFTIEGPGEIVATDNGDPTNLVSFKSVEQKAFNGLCLVIIRAKPGQAGKITLTVSSTSLQSSTAVITARIQR